MQQLQTDRQCRWLSVFGALLAFAACAGPRVDARGPAPDPEPDVLIDFNGVWFEASGAINEVGDVDLVGRWTDEDGMEWIQLRFHHGEEDPSCFEIVLPSEPKNNWEYPVELIASPDGYLSGGVLYEGVFGIGTGTATTRDVWHWWTDAWTGKRYKYKVTHVYWDPLEVYLVP